MKKLLFNTAPLLLSVLTASCSKRNDPPPTPLAEKPPREPYVKVIWTIKT
ncbi:outer membrane protein assembly factor BamB, partial [Francisella tularensis subsp. holarctica]|nr:outer membrane protein assembly factor BamB [Francisella tularensis subsp. holarctica]